MDDKEVIEDLKKRLDKINKIIYASGLTLGSDEYFEVRGLCTEGVN